MAHRRIADQAGQIGERRDVRLHVGRGRDIDVARHRADHDRAALHLDAGQFARDRVEIDDVVRRGKPQLHGRDQRLPAREDLRLFELAQHVRGLAQAGRAVELRNCTSCSPDYSAAWRVWLPSAIARHTVAGVAGIAMSSVPIASVMAFITAAGAAIAPASPQPFMPSGFDGHFVSVVSTLNDGR